MDSDTNVEDEDGWDPKLLLEPRVQLTKKDKQVAEFYMRLRKVWLQKLNAFPAVKGNSDDDGLPVDELQSPVAETSSADVCPPPPPCTGAVHSERGDADSPDLPERRERSCSVTSSVCSRTQLAQACVERVVRYEVLVRYKPDGRSRRCDSTSCHEILEDITRKKRLLDVASTPNSPIKSPALTELADLGLGVVDSPHDLVPDTVSVLLPEDLPIPDFALESNLLTPEALLEFTCSPEKGISPDDMWGFSDSDPAGWLYTEERDILEDCVETVTRIRRLKTQRAKTTKITVGLSRSGVMEEDVTSFAALLPSVVQNCATVSTCDRIPNSLAAVEEVPECVSELASVRILGLETVYHCRDAELIGHDTTGQITTSYETAEKGAINLILGGVDAVIPLDTYDATARPLATRLHYNIAESELYEVEIHQHYEIREVSIPLMDLKFTHPEFLSKHKFKPQNVEATNETDMSAKKPNRSSALLKPGMAPRTSHGTKSGKSNKIVNPSNAAKIKAGQETLAREHPYAKIRKSNRSKSKSREKQTRSTKEPSKREKMKDKILFSKFESSSTRVREYNETSSNAFESSNLDDLLGSVGLTVLPSSPLTNDNANCEDVSNGRGRLFEDGDNEDSDSDSLFISQVWSLDKDTQNSMASQAKAKTLNKKPMAVSSSSKFLGLTKLRQMVRFDKSISNAVAVRRSMQNKGQSTPQPVQPPAVLPTVSVSDYNAQETDPQINPVKPLTNDPEAVSKERFSKWQLYSTQLDRCYRKARTYIMAGGKFNYPEWRDPMYEFISTIGARNTEKLTVALERAGNIIEAEKRLFIVLCAEKIVLMREQLQYKKRLEDLREELGIDDGFKMGKLTCLTKDNVDDIDKASAGEAFPSTGLFDLSEIRSLMHESGIAQYEPQHDDLSARFDRNYANVGQDVKHVEDGTTSHFKMYKTYSDVKNDVSHILNDIVDRIEQHSVSTSSMSLCNSFPTRSLNIESHTDVLHASGEADVKPSIATPANNACNRPDDVITDQLIIRVKSDVNAVSLVGSLENSKCSGRSFSQEITSLLDKMVHEVTKNCDPGMTFQDEQLNNVCDDKQLLQIGTVEQKADGFPDTEDLTKSHLTTSLQCSNSTTRHSSEIKEVGAKIDLEENSISALLNQLVRHITDHEKIEVDLHNIDVAQGEVKRGHEILHSVVPAGSMKSSEHHLADVSQCLAIRSESIDTRRIGSKITFSSSDYSNFKHEVTDDLFDTVFSTNVMDVNDDVKLASTPVVHETVDKVDELYGDLELVNEASVEEFAVVNQSWTSSVEENESNDDGWYEKNLQIDERHINQSRGNLMTLKHTSTIGVTPHFMSDVKGCTTDPANTPKLSTRFNQYQNLHVFTSASDEDSDIDDDRLVINESILSPDSIDNSKLKLSPLVPAHAMEGLLRHNRQTLKPLQESFTSVEDGTTVMEHLKPPSDSATQSSITQIGSDNQDECGIKIAESYTLGNNDDNFRKKADNRGSYFDVFMQNSNVAVEGCISSSQNCHNLNELPSFTCKNLVVDDIANAIGLHRIKHPIKLPVHQNMARVVVDTDFTDTHGLDTTSVQNSLNAIVEFVEERCEPDTIVRSVVNHMLFSLDLHGFLVNADLTYEQPICELYRRSYFSSAKQDFLLDTCPKISGSLPYVQSPSVVGDNQQLDLESMAVASTMRLNTNAFSTDLKTALRVINWPLNKHVVSGTYVMSTGCLEGLSRTLTLKQLQHMRQGIHNVIESFMNKKYKGRVTKRSPKNRKAQNSKTQNQQLASSSNCQSNQLRQSRRPKLEPVFYEDKAETAQRKEVTVAARKVSALSQLEPTSVKKTMEDEDIEIVLSDDTSSERDSTNVIQSEWPNALMEHSYHNPSIREEQASSRLNAFKRSKGWIELVDFESDVEEDRPDLTHNKMERRRRAALSYLLIKLALVSDIDGEERWTKKSVLEASTAKIMDLPKELEKLSIIHQEELSRRSRNRSKIKEILSKHWAVPKIRERAEKALNPHRSCACEQRSSVFCPYQDRIIHGLQPSDDLLPSQHLPSQSHDFSSKFIERLRGKKYITQSILDLFSVSTVASDNDKNSSIPCPPPASPTLTIANATQRCDVESSLTCSSIKADLNINQVSKFPECSISRVGQVAKTGEEDERDNYAPEVFETSASKIYDGGTPGISKGSDNEVPHALVRSETSNIAKLFVSEFREPESQKKGHFILQNEVPDANVIEVATTKECNSEQASCDSANKHLGSRSCLPVTMPSSHYSQIVSRQSKSSSPVHLSSGLSISPNISRCPPGHFVRNPIVFLKNINDNEYAQTFEVLASKILVPLVASNQVSDTKEMGCNVSHSKPSITKVTNKRTSYPMYKTTPNFSQSKVRQATAEPILIPEIDEVNKNSVGTHSEDSIELPDIVPVPSFARRSLTNDPGWLKAKILPDEFLKLGSLVSTSGTTIIRLESPTTTKMAAANECEVSYAATLGIKSAATFTASCSQQSKEFRSSGFQSKVQKSHNCRNKVLDNCLVKGREILLPKIPMMPIEGKDDIQSRQSVIDSQKIKKLEERVSATDRRLPDGAKVASVSEQKCNSADANVHGWNQNIDADQKSGELPMMCLTDNVDISEKDIGTLSQSGAACSDNVRSKVKRYLSEIATGVSREDSSNCEKHSASTVFASSSKAKPSGRSANQQSQKVVEQKLSELPYTIENCRGIFKGYYIPIRELGVPLRAFSASGSLITFPIQRSAKGSRYTFKIVSSKKIKKNVDSVEEVVADVKQRPMKRSFSLQSKGMLKFPQDPTIADRSLLKRRDLSTKNESLRVTKPKMGGLVNMSDQKTIPGVDSCNIAVQGDDCVDGRKCVLPSCPTNYKFILKSKLGTDGHCRRHHNTFKTLRKKKPVKRPSLLCRKSKKAKHTNEKSSDVIEKGTQVSTRSRASLELKLFESESSNTPKKSHRRKQRHHGAEAIRDWNESIIDQAIMLHHQHGFTYARISEAIMEQFMMPYTPNDIKRRLRRNRKMRVNEGNSGKDSPVSKPETEVLGTMARAGTDSNKRSFCKTAKYESCRDEMYENARLVVDNMLGMVQKTERTAHDSKLSSLDEDDGPFLEKPVTDFTTQNCIDQQCLEVNNHNTMDMVSVENCPATTIPSRETVGILALTDQNTHKRPFCKIADYGSFHDENLEHTRFVIEEILDVIERNEGSSSGDFSPLAKPKIATETNRVDHNPLAADNEGVGNVIAIGDLVTSTHNENSSPSVVNNCHFSIVEESGNINCAITRTEKSPKSDAEVHISTGDSSTSVDVDTVRTGPNSTVVIAAGVTQSMIPLITLESSDEGEEAVSEDDIVVLCDRPTQGCC